MRLFFKEEYSVMTEKKRNIIIDTDPGIDDAVAIALTIAYEDRLNLLGLTTVSGNQSIDKVTDNAMRLAAFFKRDIKVAKGASAPLIREKRLGGHVHGENGMGNYELPKSVKPLYSDNAVTFMRDTIMGCEGKVTIVPIAPLTNIALLLKTFPEVKEKIELLSIMGGAARGGNITPTAEFNVYADPEAARIVFDSGLPIVMNGLDVTHDAGLYRDDLKDLVGSNGKVSSMCGKILEYYFNGDHVKNASFAPIHDASAIMYLVHPELYEYRHTPVKVDCSEDENRGMTVADLRDNSNYDESYPKVLLKLDLEKFRELLLESLYRLDETIQ